MQLRTLGISRDDVRSEVLAGRWKALGRHTVQLRHDGGDEATWRRAVWETRGQAWLDGATALTAAGLTGWEEEIVHVSVPDDARAVQVEGVRVHPLRARELAHVGDPPRAMIEWAALRAASWARSDRAATTIIAMVVQQRLTTGERLSGTLAGAPAMHRIGLVRQVVADVRGGAQALSEIDFARLCRTHGIPEPDRQAVRPGPRGRIYLDALWADYDVIVEIDGFQHASGLAALDDALRDNLAAIGGMRTLRIPALGLRAAPDAFLGQVATALRNRGWRP